MIETPGKKFGLQSGQEVVIMQILYNVEYIPAALKEVKEEKYLSVWFGKGKVEVCHATHLLQKLPWKHDQI